MIANSWFLDYGYWFGEGPGLGLEFGLGNVLWYKFEHELSYALEFEYGNALGHGFWYSLV